MILVYIKNIYQIIRNVLNKHVWLCMYLVVVYVIAHYTLRRTLVLGVALAVIADSRCGVRTGNGYT